jgi:cytochrome c556
MTEKLSLPEAWFELCKLNAEGDKLYAEASKLNAEASKRHAEGLKLYAEGDKLRAEGDKLYAEADKLCAEGQLLFIDAVIANLGPKTDTQWTPDGCLVVGKLYKYEEPV